MRYLRVITFVVAAFFAATLSFAEPQFPELTAPIVDAANILDADAKVIIENKLRNFETTSGHQLAVATVPSLEGYDIREYGNLLFRHWQLGDKQRNDGVLILIAPVEHKVSIEVGYGLEGDLTDAMSRMIIENALVPRFKANDYIGGIHAGIDDVIKVVGGQGDEVVQRVQNQTALSGDDIIPLIIFFVIIVFILWNVSRGRRMIFVPMGSSGGGGFSSGGGFSGGGGWSGGGGSSGGGGASGGW